MGILGGCRFRCSPRRLVRQTLRRSSRCASTWLGGRQEDAPAIECAHNPGANQLHPVVQHLRLQYRNRHAAAELLWHIATVLNASSHCVQKSMRRWWRVGSQCVRDTVRPRRTVSKGRCKLLSLAILPLPLRALPSWYVGQELLAVDIFLVSRAIGARRNG